MAVTGARIIGGEDFEKALTRAFQAWTKEDINDAFWDDQFKKEKWEHSPLTIRKNGEPVGSPRDIYDLGNLYQSGVDSYKYESSSQTAEARWHWDAKNNSGKEYAIYVHEGWGTNDPYDRRFTDDVSDMAFSFRKPIGKALLLRVKAALTALNAN
jgi:hypothetical protein